MQAETIGRVGGVRMKQLDVTSAAMVFSHPNHEIAVLGAIGRLRPRIIFLTDGGGADRVAQSRAGLSSYLAEHRLHFLDHSEASFYEALLNRDVDFFRGVAEEVSAKILDSGAEAVFCDAIEFYNPVHDLALPIVRAALGDRSIPIYEVPLIHQRETDGGYELQRAPGALEPDCVWFELSEDELSRKTETLSGRYYSALFGQLGGTISAAVPGRASREQFLEARRHLPEPAGDQQLRYDRRGRELEASGKVPQAITYREHYAPMFASLCG